MGREYITEEGTKISSVTTILSCLGSEELMYWANNLGFKHISYAKELNRVAVAGTKIHGMLEKLIRSNDSVDPIPVNVDPNTADGILFNKISERYNKDFVLQFRINSISIEESLISKELGFGGTPDWLVELNGNTCLIDFKSSKKVHIKHLLQLGGYNLLLKEKGVNLEYAGIYLINETRSYLYIIGIEELDVLSEAFRYISKYYSIMKDYKLSENKLDHIAPF